MTDASPPAIEEHTAARDGPRFPSDLEERFHDPTLLGEGSMGRVYRVLDTARGQEVVALKILAGRADDEVLRRFSREARAMEALDHPNILRILDHGACEGGPYLVMEYLEGDLLGPELPREQAMDAMLQVAEALEEIHAQGTVHRDLKPANIFRTHEGRTVVLDFGLASNAEWTVLTKTGVGVGSLAYMSPETLRGERATPASDWYAWGATLYRVLEGTIPYDADDIRTVAKGEDSPDLEFHQVPADGPEARVIRACMNPDPTARPGSVVEIHQVLRRKRTDTRRRWRQPSEAWSVPVVEPSGLATPRRRQLLLVLACGALGLGFGLGLALHREPTTSGVPAPAPPARADPPPSSFPLPPDLPQRLRGELTALQGERAPDGRALLDGDPVHWPRVLERLPALRELRAWVREGGRAEELPEDFLEDLGMTDQLFENVLLPRPGFPWSAPVLAPEATEDPLAGSRLAGLPLPEPRGPAFRSMLRTLRTLSLEYDARLAAHDAARTGEGPETTLFRRSLVPLKSNIDYPKLARTEFLSPQGREFLSRDLSSLFAVMRELLFRTGRVLREEPDVAAAAALLAATEVERIRPAWFGVLSFEPPEDLLAGPVRTAAGETLRSGILWMQSRAREHLRDPSWERLRDEALAGYLRAFTHASGEAPWTRAVARHAVFRRVYVAEQLGDSATVAETLRKALASQRPPEEWFSLAASDRILDSWEDSGEVPFEGPTQARRLLAALEHLDPTYPPDALLGEGDAPALRDRWTSRLEGWLRDR